MKNSFATGLSVLAISSLLVGCQTSEPAEGSTETQEKTSESHTHVSESDHDHSHSNDEETKQIYDGF